MGGTMDTENLLGELITIPAGSFLMGNSGNEGYGGPAEFPQHSVDLPTYQIGKHEVTRGEYRRFIEAGRYQDPQYWSLQGWEWKESDVIVHAGMYGKVRRVKRPEGSGPRNAPSLSITPDREPAMQEADARLNILLDPIKTIYE